MSLTQIQTSPSTQSNSIYWDYPLVEKPLSQLISYLANDKLEEACHNINNPQKSYHRNPQRLKEIDQVIETGLATQNEFSKQLNDLYKNLAQVLLEKYSISCRAEFMDKLIGETVRTFLSLQQLCGASDNPESNGKRMAKETENHFQTAQKILDDLVAFHAQVELLSLSLDHSFSILTNFPKLKDDLPKIFQKIAEHYHSDHSTKFIHLKKRVEKHKTQRGPNISFLVEVEKKSIDNCKAEKELKKDEIKKHEDEKKELEQAAIDYKKKVSNMTVWLEKIQTFKAKFEEKWTSKEPKKNIDFTIHHPDSELIQEQNIIVTELSAFSEELTILVSAYYGFLGRFSNGDLDLLKLICNFQKTKFISLQGKVSDIKQKTTPKLDKLDQEIYKLSVAILKWHHDFDRLDCQIKKVQKTLPENGLYKKIDLKNSKIQILSIEEDPINEAKSFLIGITEFFHKVTDDSKLSCGGWSTISKIDLKNAEIFKKWSLEQYTLKKDEYEKMKTSSISDITGKIKKEENRLLEAISKAKQEKSLVAEKIKKIIDAVFDARQHLYDFQTWCGGEDNTKILDPLCEDIRKIPLLSPDSNLVKTSVDLEKLRAVNAEGFVSGQDYLVKLQELINRIANFKLIETSKTIDRINELDIDSSSLIKLKDDRFQKIIRGLLTLQNEYENGRLSDNGKIENKKKQKILVQQRVDIETRVAWIESEIKTLSRSSQSLKENTKNKKEDLSEVPMQEKPFESIATLDQLLDVLTSTKVKLKLDLSSYSNYNQHRDSLVSLNRGDKEIARKVYLVENQQFQYLLAIIKDLGTEARLREVELTKTEKLLLSRKETLTYLNDEINNTQTEIEKVFTRQDGWFK